MQNGKISNKLPFWLSWNIVYLKGGTFSFIHKPSIWAAAFFLLLGAHTTLVSMITPSDTAPTTFIDRTLAKLFPFIHEDTRNKANSSLIFGLMAWSLPLLVVSALRVDKAASQAISFQGKLCSILCALTLLSYLCSVLLAFTTCILGQFAALSKFFGCSMAIHGLSFVVDYLMLKRSDIDAVREMYQFCDHLLSSNPSQQTFAQLSNFQKVLHSLFDMFRKARDENNNFRLEWFAINKIQQLWKKAQNQGWAKALFFQEFVNTVKTPRESNDVVFLMIAKSSPHLLRELLPELSLAAHKRACGKLIKLMGWKPAMRYALCTLDNEEFMERLIQLAADCECPPPAKTVEKLRAMIKEERSRSVERVMDLLGSRIHLPPPPSRDQGDNNSPTAKPSKAASVDESWIVI